MIYFQCVEFTSSQVFSVGTELTGPVAIVALMGDPMMAFERLISGWESTLSLKKMERGHCPGDEVKATVGVINPENTVKCISELYVRRKHLNDETLLCVILEHKVIVCSDEAY